MRFKKYIKNASWSLSGKLISLPVTFVVSVVLARYLGPEKFGIYSYAVSLVSIFAVTGHLGLAGLAVKEFVKEKIQPGEAIGTILFLKFAGLAVGFFGILAYILIFEKFGSLEFYVLLILSLSIPLTSFVVLRFWFQANEKFKILSIVSIIGLLAASLSKVILILYSISLPFIVLVNVLQLLFTSTILIVLFRRKWNIPFRKIKISFTRGKKLLRNGSLIFIGSIFATIYLKIDQVMLRWIIGQEEVGIYAISAKLSEIWYVIPATLVLVIFPRLIKLKDENPNLFRHRMQQTSDLLFCLGSAMALIISLSANFVIIPIFGSDYERSVPILQIHIWAAVFIFMRALLSKWIIIQSFFLFSLITQGAGAVMNLLLNFILIPRLGAEGAAWATLFSYATASFFVLVLSAKTRPIFKMMCLSFLSPIRYPLQLLHKK